MKPESSINVIARNMRKFIRLNIQPKAVFPFLNRVTSLGKQYSYEVYSSEGISKSFRTES